LCPFSFYLKKEKGAEFGGWVVAGGGWVLGF